MIRYASLVLIVSLIFGSCLGRKDRDERLAVHDSLAALKDFDEAPGDTTDHGSAEDMESGEDGCVFDTSTYKFTTEKLKKYKPNISYHWDQWQAEARTVLDDGDTLWLHIGGCDHFSYTAVLGTSLTITDSAALMEKTRWLARTFLENDFDTKYDKWIAQGQFERDGNSVYGERLFYNTVDPDTAVTDHVYEGFSFTRRGARTRIEITGYIN
jgi:hypothetical protein